MGGGYTVCTIQSIYLHEQESKPPTIQQELQNASSIMTKAVMIYARNNYLCFFCELQKIFIINLLETQLYLMSMPFIFINFHWLNKAFTNQVQSCNSDKVRELWSLKLIKVYKLKINHVSWNIFKSGPNAHICAIACLINS